MIQIKIGRWTLGEILDTHLTSNSKVECKCDCGIVRAVKWHNLKSGYSRSCGCLSKDTKPSLRHGMKGTAIYSRWAAMVARCNNPNATQYKYYGGRGIKVCERWLLFDNFYADLGDIPSGLEIDRIDSDGDYEPSNVRFVSHKTNINNRRKLRRISHNGKTQTIAEWAEETGLKYNVIWNRIKRGWTTNDALSP